MKQTVNNIKSNAILAFIYLSVFQPDNKSGSRIRGTNTVVT